MVLFRMAGVSLLGMEPSFLMRAHRILSGKVFGFCLGFAFRPFTRRLVFLVFVAHILLDPKLPVSRGVQKRL